MYYIISILRSGRRCSVFFSLETMINHLPIGLFVVLNDVPSNSLHGNTCVQYLFMYTWMTG